MTLFDTIRVFLAKVILLVGALILRSRWYEKFQEFEWAFIQFNPLVPSSILGMDLEVHSSSLQSLEAAWRYLMKEPRLWNDDCAEEKVDEDQEDFEDYPYDDNAAVRLLAHTIFTEEFHDAIQEHPEWKKFLV